MMEDWEDIALNEICEKAVKVKRKEMPVSMKLKYIDIGVIDNAQNRIVGHKEYQWKNAPSRAQQIVKKNDVLFSTVRTYLKNIAQVTKDEYDDEICSSGFTVIRGKRDIVIPKLLFYFSLSPGFLNSLSKLQTGTSYPSVRNKDVFAQLFPLPPLPIQRAIVSKIESLFSSLDSGIADLKKAQEQLKIYRQAVLKKAFEGELTKEWREQQTDLLSAEELLERIQYERENIYKTQISGWEKEVKKWKEGGKNDKKPTKPKMPTNLDSKISIRENEALSLSASEFWSNQPLAFISDNKPNCIVDGPFGSSINVAEDYKEKGIPVIRMVNIRSMRFIPNNLKFIIKEKFLQLRRHNILPQDILIAKVGATIGDCCIYPENQPEGMLSTTGSCRVRLDPKVYLPKVLQYYIFYQKYKLKSIASQTAQPFLNMKVLKAFPVPLLSIQEQHQLIIEIEYRLTVFDKVEESIKESLEKAQALRQSILKKAFEGKLLTEAEIERCKQEADYEPASVLLERIKKEKKNA